MTIQLGIGEIKAAQDTPEGYRRVYMRLARANHPYEYENADGTRRIEIIKTDDLFDPVSVASAKNLPTLIQHPGFKLDSQNIGGLAHGALGEKFVRESTSDGDFLGVVGMIYTDEAKRASERMPGVSPGYRVQVERADAENTFYQKSRNYNHLALAVNPRGGKGVEQIFEGVRIDGVPGSDVWVARYDDRCYASDVSVNREFIEDAIAYRGDALFLEKSRIDLDRVDLSSPTETKERHDKACGCDECTVAEKAAKADQRGQGFGIPTTKKKKKKRMAETTTIALDGVSYSGVPMSFVQAVKPKLDRLDSLEDEILTTEQDLAIAQSRIDSLSDEIDRRDEEEEVSDRIDASDDSLTYTPDEAFAFARRVAGTVDTIQSDIEALQSAGRIDASDGIPDFDTVVENLPELQRDIIRAARPSMAERLDSSGDRVDAIAEEDLPSQYEMAMEIFGESVASRVDSQPQQKPSLLNVAKNLRHDGAAGSSAQSKRQAAIAELQMQDAIFDGKSAQPSVQTAMSGLTRQFTVHGA